MKNFDVLSKVFVDNTYFLNHFKQKNNMLKKIYNDLLQKHGLQGWWPIINKKTLICEYHPGDYNYPKNYQEQFEIIIGCILTQNTAWKNVEKALKNLKQTNMLNPENILSATQESLEILIRPSGYFKQKSTYLKNIAKFYLSLKKKTPSREELLLVRGVGSETADSILLYAYKQPEFVIDAYTRKVFSRFGLISGQENYDRMKQLFEENLPKDYRLFQEYHALIIKEEKKKQLISKS